MSWTRIRELVRKEFIQLLRDRRYRLILFVAPFIQMLVFGYVVNYDIRNIRVAVVDYSQTLESRKLADAFAGSPIFPLPTGCATKEPLRICCLPAGWIWALKSPPILRRSFEKGRRLPFRSLPTVR